MVYTNRTEKCISSQDNPAAKTTANSSYQSSCGQNNPAKQTNNAWSKSVSEADKWKYNKMVRDDRDKFNSMHFC